MKKDYTYIGFICIDNDGKYLLVTKSKNRFNLTGIDGNDSLSKMNLHPSEAMFVVVKYFDGTESVEQTYAHNVNYEDIFFAIENHIIIKTDYPSIFDILYNDYNELLFLWSLIEEYYESKMGTTNFINFQNKKHFK